MTARTPWTSTEAQRTTQRPEATPDQASITLSEARRTRLGEPLGSAEPSGSAKRSSRRGAPKRMPTALISAYTLVMPALVSAHARIARLSSLSSDAICACGAAAATRCTGAPDGSLVDM